MYKKGIGRKIVSFVTTFAMLFTMFPAIAGYSFAETEGGEATPPETAVIESMALKMVDPENTERYIEGEYQLDYSIDQEPSEDLIYEYEFQVFANGEKYDKDKFSVELAWELVRYDGDEEIPVGSDVAELYVNENDPGRATVKVNKFDGKFIYIRAVYSHENGYGYKDFAWRANYLGEEDTEEEEDNPIAVKMVDPEFVSGGYRYNCNEEVFEVEGLSFDFQTFMYGEPFDKETLSGELEWNIVDFDSEEPVDSSVAELQVNESDAGKATVTIYSAEYVDIYVVAKYTDENEETATCKFNLWGSVGENGDSEEPWEGSFDVKMIDPDSEGDSYCQYDYRYDYNEEEIEGDSISYEFQAFLDGEAYDGSSQLIWSIFGYKNDEETGEPEKVSIDSDVAYLQENVEDPGKATVVINVPNETESQDIYVKAEYITEEIETSDTFNLYGQIRVSEYPIANLIFFVNEEQKSQRLWFDEEDNRAYGYLPFSYNREKEAFVEVKYYRNNIEEYEIVWEEDEEGELYGIVEFSSGEGEDAQDYRIKIYVNNEPANDVGCNIYYEATDGEGSSWGRNIDWEEAASEEGAIITIPYGYLPKVELEVSPYHECAYLEGFYNEGEEEQGYTVVQAGVAKEFNIVAEDGTVQNYKITFVESDGKTVNVKMNAHFIDLNLVDSDFDASRWIDIEFEEGETSTEVVLPYLYDDTEGIDLNLVKTDNYSSSLDEGDTKVYLGGENDEDGDINAETVEFTVTPPALDTPIKYEVNFRRETAEEAQKVNFEKFVLEYNDTTGERKQVEIDTDKAASEEGYDVLIPVTDIPEECEEFFVNVLANTSEYNYIGQAEHEHGWSEISSDELRYEVDLSSRGIAVLTFEVKATNGEMVPFKIRIINSIKAIDPSIEEVVLSYTTSDGRQINDWLWLGEQSGCETTIYPYDTNEDIIISGIAADGSEINEVVYIKDGVGTAKIVSEALVGNAKKEYDITVNVYENPIVILGYYEIYEDGEEDYCYHSVWMDNNGIGATMISYEDANRDLEIRVLTMNDGVITPENPVIEWEEDTGDPSDILKGKITFEIGEGDDKEEYTAYIIREGLEDLNAGFDLEFSCDENSQYMRIEEGETDEITVVFPYGCEEGMLYVTPDSGISVDDREPGKWRYWRVYAEDGEKTFTITALDGTTKTYTIKFAKSDGLSTEVDAYIHFGRGDDNQWSKHLKFKDFVEKDGKMVAELMLPYDYNEAQGLEIFVDSIVGAQPDFEGSQIFKPEFNDKASFEFEVTSANGDVTTPYVINFTKETEEQGKATNLEWVGVNYGSGMYDLEDADQIVDLSKVEDGNIEITIPKSQVGKLLALRVYSKDYTGIDNNDLKQGIHIAGLGDPWMFEELYYIEENAPVDLSFDVISSDGSQTQTYNITIAIEPDHVHTFDWEVTKEPTCTKEGEEVGKCTCGAEETKAISVIPHTYKTEVTDPTCTEEGYTTYTCECGATYKDDEVDALGHSYKSRVKFNDENHWTVSTCTREACKHSYTGEAAKHTTTTANNKTICTAEGCKYEKHVVEIANQSGTNKAQQITIESAHDDNISQSVKDKFKIETVEQLIETFIEEIVDITKDDGFAEEAIKAAEEEFQSFEVTLQVKENDKWEESEGDATFKEGIAVTLPFVPSADKGELIILHLCGNGTIEHIKDYTVVDGGIQITVYSLSPFMVAQLDRSVTDEAVSISAIPDQVYTGEEINPELVVKYGEEQLVEGQDYTVKYGENVNAGTGTVTIMGTEKENEAGILYTGSRELTFNILPENITSATVTGINSSYAYTGKAIAPAVTVKSGDKKLVNGTDYTVSYAKNTNAGTATVTITGKGNYAGTVTKNFTIAKQSASQCKVSLSTTNYTYNGKAKKPSVTVKNAAGVALKNGTDYTVSYAKGRAKIGRYKVTVTFKGNYSGSTALYFVIGPKNTSSVKTTLYGYDDVKITWKKVSGVTGYKVYYKTPTSGYKLLKTTKSTSYKKKNLSDGVKYTFKVVAYKKAGGYNCENTGKTSSIYTLKKIAGVKAVKSGSKVKVSWTNISGESGYQISQSTSKSKTKVVSTYKTTSGKSKTISAAKGKTYYYKVRTYKTVSGKKIYGPWSAVVKYKR